MAKDIFDYFLTRGFCLIPGPSQDPIGIQSMLIIGVFGISNMFLVFQMCFRYYEYIFKFQIQVSNYSFEFRVKF